MSAVHRLVEAAVQAPTGDNCQPWRFELASDRIALRLDRARARSVFDVDDVASLLALGAAWENMVLAASARGLRADGRVEGGDPAWLSLSLRPDDDLIGDPLARQIFVRRTTRWPYARAPLTLEQVQAIEACGQGRADIEVRTGPAAHRLHPLVVRCDRLRWEHPPLIDELLGKLRLDALAKFATRTGLAFDTLGVGRAPLAMLRWLARGQRARRLGPLGLSLAMAAQTGLHLDATPALVVLRCDVTRPRAVVEAGRALQRTWLQACALGLSMQPMASVPLLCLRAARGQDQDFAARHRRWLAELLAAWQRETDRGDGRYAVMLLRLGRGPRTPSALRLPVAAFVPPEPCHAD